MKERKPKFRVWDKENKLMFYFDKDYSSSDNIGIPSFTNKDSDYFISYNDLFDIDQTTWIPLEYTGFKDKDKVKIYEGDIVNTYFMGKVVAIHQILFYDFSWVKDSHKALEVIGNIYKNPELLEKVLVNDCKKQ